MNIEIKRIRNALAWLIEQQIRNDPTGQYLGKSVSELTERIFAGEPV